MKISKDYAEGKQEKKLYWKYYKKDVYGFDFQKITVKISGRRKNQRRHTKMVNTVMV